MKKELETNKINEKNCEQIKINEEEEEIKINEKLSNSFSSENSSETTSFTESPSKDIDNNEFNSNKVKDFFPSELNFELEFFSGES